MKSRFKKIKGIHCVINNDRNNYFYHKVHAPPESSTGLPYLNLTCTRNEQCTIFLWDASDQQETEREVQEVVW